MQALLQIQQAARNVLEENMYVRRCRLCFCPWDIEGGRPKEGRRQAELELGGHKVLKILWGGEGS